MTAEGGCGSVALQIPYLIQDKILDSSAAIAQRSPYPGVDEISEQNAVARQNWYRIHSYVREVRAEPTFQIRRESLNEGRLKFLGA